MGRQSNKDYKRHVTFNISDAKEYDFLINNIKNMWYRKYGVALTKGEVVRQSLIIADNILKDDNFGVKEKTEKFDARSKYGRLSGYLG